MRERRPLSSRSAWEILSDPALWVYLVAHHPTCSRFRNHMVPVPGRRRALPVCAGCVPFWPALLLGVPLLLWAAQSVPVPWWALFFVGFPLGAAQLLSYAGRVDSRGAKLTVKLAFGLGAAAVIAGLLVAPWHPALRIALGVSLAAGTALLHLRRSRNMLAVCDACPWARDWQHCPGFAPLNDHSPSRGPPSSQGGSDGEAGPEPWPAGRARQPVG